MPAKGVYDTVKQAIQDLIVPDLERIRGQLTALDARINSLEKRVDEGLGLCGARRMRGCALSTTASTRSRSVSSRATAASMTPTSAWMKRSTSASGLLRLKRAWLRAAERGAGSVLRIDWPLGGTQPLWKAGRALPEGGAPLHARQVYRQPRPITVALATTNIPQGTPLTVRVATDGPAITAPSTPTNASGNASATLTVPAGFGTIQAYAEYTATP